MSFRYIATICLILVSLQLMPTTAMALPVFEWIEPWGPDFKKTTFGDAWASAAFGASATADGQKTDLGNTGDIGPASAVLKAEVLVDPDILYDSTARAIVDFYRTFELSGSPLGWDVTLSASREGELKTENAKLNPQAQVITWSFILAGDFNSFMKPVPGHTMTHSIDFGGNRSVLVRNGVGAKVIPILYKDKQKLSDGKYTVMGELDIFARIEDAVFMSGFASSEFFDSLTVNVSATVVPEPSNIVLFSTGLLGLVWITRRRWS